MRVRILAAIILGCALSGRAQTNNAQPPVRSLSLRECIDMALSRNLNLQIEHLSTDVAAFNYRATYGAYDPTLSFSATRNFISQPGNFDPKKSGFDFPYELTSDTATPGLTGRLPMGFTYNFGGSFTAEHGITDFRGDTNTAKSFPPFGIRDTNNYLANVGGTVQQHLLRDFWIDQYRETMRLRRKDLKISQQALRFQIMSTVLIVELNYFDLIAARETIRAQEKTLELNQQFLKETQRRVEVGDLPPLDSEQAETQLENTLTALAAARELYVDQQNALRNLITDNFREWADVELEPADTLVAVPTPINRSESFVNALKTRPDLIEARLAVQKSDVTVQFRKNQLFPFLDFIGNYGGLAIDNDSSSALSDALHFRQPAYYYGVVVSYPLSNVGARNDYRASQANKQIAELQLKKAEQDVLVQVADWVNRVQSRFTQVGSTHKARAYAESALAAEEKKLQNGLSTSFVVLQLQNILTAARTAEIKALADYNKALAQLAFTDGSTMEKRHLLLELK
jgi:outer membrane protein TolC